MKRTLSRFTHLAAATGLLWAATPAIAADQAPATPPAAKTATPAAPATTDKAAAAAKPATTDDEHHRRHQQVRDGPGVAHLHAVLSVGQVMRKGRPP